MIYYKHRDFEKDISQVVEWVQARSEATSPGVKWTPNTVISIARGGLVPGVYLSHALGIENIPIRWQNRDGAQKDPLPERVLEKGHQILIVDDINDSGKTFNQIHKWIRRHWTQSYESMKVNVKTVSMWSRYNSTFNVDFSPRKVDNNEWIVFPWEKSNESS